MRDALAKLLLIAAILFMPFGMTAPAAASAHHAPGATMDHCPDKSTNADQRHSGAGECTMGCATALPAIGRTGGGSLAPVAVPSLRVLAAPLAGLQPETATPPPRIA